MERAPKRHLFDKVVCLFGLETTNNRTNKCGTIEIKLDDRAQYQSQTQNTEFRGSLLPSFPGDREGSRKTKCNLFAS